MQDLRFEVLNRKNLEQCRGLFEALMAYQKAKAKITPEVFDAMRFETRIQQVYEQALASEVVLARAGDVPAGYVFSTIQQVIRNPDVRPEWAPAGSGKNSLGFYPDWDDFPAKIGCLNNLFVCDAYRGMRLGSELFERSMAWFERFPEVELIWIYVSNGNSAALDFYLERGFILSHDVFGGFIKAVYKHIR